jgi:zinc transport system substrate-binding protein
MIAVLKHGRLLLVVARIVLTALACLAVTVGCGADDDDAAAGGRREVVAAFYPLAFAAERVGGDSVDVTNLTPPGTEPHDVELSARDVERVRDADVVLSLGAGFMPALEDAVADADGEAIDLLAGFELREGAENEDAEGEELDPHVWLDPVRFRRLVTRIGATLERPEAAAALAARLTSLDGEFRRGLASCARREIVTSHAAFGYLADRYRLEQIPITGISPEAEPTARDLEDIVDEVREHGATTIFFETLVSPRLARTVAREVGADTDVLNPLEGLTEDESERGENYFSVMRSNLATLRKALDCR